MRKSVPASDVHLLQYLTVSLQFSCTSYWCHSLEQVKWKVMNYLQQIPSTGHNQKWKNKRQMQQEVVLKPKLCNSYSMTRRFEYIGFKNMKWWLTPNPPTNIAVLLWLFIALMLLEAVFLGVWERGCVSGGTNRAACLQSLLEAPCSQHAGLNLAHTNIEVLVIKLLWLQPFFFFETESMYGLRILMNLWLSLMPFKCQLWAQARKGYFSRELGVLLHRPVACYWPCVTPELSVFIKAIWPDRGNYTALSVLFVYVNLISAGQYVTVHVHKTKFPPTQTRTRCTWTGSKTTRSPEDSDYRPTVHLKHTSVKGCSLTSR